MPLQSPAKKREEELEKKLRDIKIQESEDRYAGLAQKFGLPFSTLKGVPIDTEALNLVDEGVARKSNLAILYKIENRLIVAIVNPEDPETKQTLDLLKKNGFSLDLLITTPDMLSSVWQRYKTIKQKVFKIGAIQINEDELAELQEQIKDIGDLTPPEKTQEQEQAATMAAAILEGKLEKVLQLHGFLQPATNASKYEFLVNRTP